MKLHHQILATAALFDHPLTAKLRRTATFLQIMERHTELVRRTTVEADADSTLICVLQLNDTPQNRLPGTVLKNLSVLHIFLKAES